MPLGTSHAAWGKLAKKLDDERSIFILKGDVLVNGQVALSSSDDPEDNELIATTRHKKSRYIDRNPSRGSRIRSAPVVRYTNTELRLLENIVGRDVPRHLRRAAYEY